MGKKLLCVALGGFAGTLCRYGLDHMIPWPAGGMPLGILLINLSGCLLLAWLLAGGAQALRFSSEVRLLIGTGFLGSFTTMSAFAVGTLKLLDSGLAGTAALYVLLSTAGGLLMAWCGAWLGRRMSAGREGETA